MRDVTTKVIAIVVVLFIAGILLPTAIQPMVNTGNYTQYNQVTNETLVTTASTNVSSTFDVQTTNSPVVNNTIYVTTQINGSEKTFDYYDDEINVTDSETGNITLTFEQTPEADTDINADYEYTTTESYSSVMQTLIQLFIPAISLIALAMLIIRYTDLA